MLHVLGDSSPVAAAGTKAKMREYWKFSGILVVATVGEALRFAYWHNCSL